MVNSTGEFDLCITGKYRPITPIANAYLTQHQTFLLFFYHLTNETAVFPPRQNHLQHFKRELSIHFTEIAEVNMLPLMIA